MPPQIEDADSPSARFDKPSLTDEDPNEAHMFARPLTDESVPLARLRKPSLAETVLLLPRCRGVHSPWLSRHYLIAGAITDGSTVGKGNIEEAAAHMGVTRQKFVK